MEENPDKRKAIAATVASFLLLSAVCILVKLQQRVPDLLSVIGIVLVSAGGLLAILLHEKDNKTLKHHWH